MVRARLGDYETRLTYSDSPLSNGERAREVGCVRIIRMSIHGLGIRSMQGYVELSTYLSFNV
jgi:hypothetical protein